MGKPLQADKLRAEIELQEFYVAELREHQVKVTKELRQHTAILRRLKAAAKCTSRRYSRYQHPWVDNEAGLEWYSFKNAVKYGVTLKGAGWYLAFGRGRSTRASNVTFYFDIDLDKRTRVLLSAYVPGGILKKRGKEVVCTHLSDALAMSQLVRKPTRICWIAATAAGKLASHDRIYVTTYTENIRFIRRIGEACE